jgi:hypothetical protein
MLLGMFLVCESVQIETWRLQTNCVISGGACSPLAQQGTAGASQDAARCGA